MAILGWLRNRRKKAPIQCKRGRGYTFSIAGAGSYQSNLLKICGGKKSPIGVKQEERATLRPEPDNPHDPSAVVIFIRGKKAGYLRREDAPIFIRFLNEFGAESAVCNARIIGGWDDGEGDEGHYGVRLSLSWPPKAA